MEDNRTTSTMQSSNHNHDEHCHDCKGMCGAYGHGRYVLARWVLGILILAVVFSIGLKIGEFKGYMENGYGMYGGNGQYQQFPPMRHNRMYMNQDQMMQPQAGTSSNEGMMQPTK